jgi:hypothetical protein
MCGTPPVYGCRGGIEQGIQVAGRVPRLGVPWGDGDEPNLHQLAEVDFDGRPCAVEQVGQTPDAGPTLAGLAVRIASQGRIEPDADNADGLGVVVDQVVIQAEVVAGVT